MIVMVLVGPAGGTSGTKLESSSISFDRGKNMADGAIDGIGGSSAWPSYKGQLDRASSTASDVQELGASGNGALAQLKTDGFDKPAVDYSTLDPDFSKELKELEQLEVPDNVLSPDDMDLSKGPATGPDWSTNGQIELRDRNTIVCDGKGDVKIQIGLIGNADQTACLQECVKDHERSHRTDAKKSTPDLCKGKMENEAIVPNERTRKASEIDAYNVEIGCLERQRVTDSDKCQKIIEERLKFIRSYRDSIKQQ